MEQHIADLTNHLTKAISIANNTELKSNQRTINNVLVCGLGGSGIGGTIASQLLAEVSNVPIHVNKDYEIPAFVNKQTLVIISSYSGNTEETLTMLKAAIAKNAEIVCLTSGGKVEQIAKTNNYNLIVIPDEFPPRAAFGLAFPQLFKFLAHYKIIPNQIEFFEKSIALIEKETDAIKTKAKALANQLYNKIPVLYSAAPFEGVMVRFRQQINENSKMLCWHHALPEMNHNELVGWTNKNDDLAVVFFRTEADNYRTQKRIEITKDVVSKYTSNVTEVYAKGNSNIEKAIYLIHLGDWVSLYLANLKHIDPVEVNIITHLKNELAKI